MLALWAFFTNSFHKYEVKCFVCAFSQVTEDCLTELEHTQDGKIAEGVAHRLALKEDVCQDNLLFHTVQVFSSF